MKTLLFSPRARADFNEIWDYTAERWDADQADSYVRRIDETCAKLASGIIVGTSINDIRARYSKHFVGSHVLFYRENDSEIEVVRILHQRMDAGRHLS